MTERKGLLALLFLLVWVPVHALAQSGSTGAIAGVARDTTGAVLPGVTVEAASPALIEKVRTAVTDAQGNYKIIDLRPGAYTVTFTLVGFSAYKRDGIELNAGFTATANADMKVGGLEETVTVTGASPVVDVQNSRVQQVLRADVLDALPTGSKSVQTYVNMTLGAAASSGNMNDVGGDKGEQASGIAIHGSRGDDGKVNLDGMNINNFNGSGGGRMRVYYPNMVAAQEVVIDTGGNMAESETGGANQNIVPREGGNTFSLYGAVNWTNDRFSTKSVSDELLARGAREYSPVKVIYDYGIGVGGPVLKDRLWFYATNRWWGSQNPGVNNWFNKSTDWRVYDPDLSRPAYTDSYYRDTSVRLTWQASSKDKVSLEEHLQHGCSCWLAIGGGSLNSPETGGDFFYPGQWLTQATWTRTATNKLLIQASASFGYQSVITTGLSALNKNKFTFVGDPGLPPPTYRVTEQTTSRGWGGAPYPNVSPNNNLNQRVSASYVTGSHAFKGGIQTLQGEWDADPNPASSVFEHPGRYTSYTFRSGLPIQLTQSANPSGTSVRVYSLGLFAQDQWTMKRLTLNVGVRYDQFRGRAPAISLEAGPLIQARTLPALEDTPDYKDVTLRTGAAYDIFGNSKTAVKGSFGRFLLGGGGGITSNVSPANALVGSATRNWNDTTFPVGDPRRGNFVPDCDLKNLQVNGECGQVSNLLFGQVVPSTFLHEEVRAGWGVRQYNYQTTVGFQHELRPALGLAVNYHRTWWRNHTVTENTLVTPADFREFCVAGPTDPLLGSYSGNRVCGLYNVNPNKQGQVNSVIRLAKNLGFGQPEEIYNGVDISLSGRWGDGAFAAGGISLGQQGLNSCWLNGHPELGTLGTTPRNADYCDIKSPLWDSAYTQIKAQAVYPLPWGLQMSGTFKHVPGIPRTASVTYTNAQVAPELGRNLSACPPTATAASCTSTVSVSILPSAQAGDDGSRAAALFESRLTQVDLRFTKAFRFSGRRRVQGMFDIYNVLSSRPEAAINGTYGPQWRTPTSLVTGRLFKFGAQVNW